jgi:hypothetical protein
VAAAQRSLLFSSRDGEFGDIGSSDLGLENRSLLSYIADFAGGDFVLRDFAGFTGAGCNQGRRSILKLACTARCNHYVAKIAIETLLNTHGLLLKK